MTFFRVGMGGIGRRHWAGRAAALVLAALWVAAAAPGVRAAPLQEGRASYYADRFEGRSTASGETYKHSAFTAAHRTLPFGTRVRVTHAASGKSVVVRINDRGPFHPDRVIDLSRSAARRIGMLTEGSARVRLEVLTTAAAAATKGGTPAAGAPARGAEIYRVQTRRVAPSGYGVQIGSFREMVNMMRMVDQTPHSDGQAVFVEVGRHGGAKLYRVILGPATDRPAAGKMAQRLKSRYPDCFVYRFGPR